MHSQSKADDKRRFGAVYTPRVLSEWAAAVLLKYLGPKPDQFVIDPACGDGALLASVAAKSKENRLLGVDIDPRAISRARGRLRVGTRLAIADALVPLPDCDTLSAWEKLLVDGRPNGIIANPPWGGAVTHSTAALLARGFSLAKGQFDSFELFIELALRITWSSK